VGVEGWGGLGEWGGGRSGGTIQLCSYSLRPHRYSPVPSHQHLSRSRPPALSLFAPHPPPLCIMDIVSIKLSLSLSLAYPRELFLIMTVLRCDSATSS